MSKFKSIRTFIGAINFQESIEFYLELNFKEVKLSENISYFKIHDNLGFYLQKAYVKDWVDNSMLFLEVENIEEYLQELKGKCFFERFPKARISEIVNNDWGKEFFLHDPSGILWHIGSFNN